jgi:hypothetical protein
LPTSRRLSSNPIPQKKQSVILLREQTHKRQRKKESKLVNMENHKTVKLNKKRKKKQRVWKMTRKVLSK